MREGSFLLKMPPLRAASVTDEDAIVDLLRIMHREAPAGTWSETKVRTAVRDCLATGAVILSLSNEVPVGTLGLCAASWWWSDDAILQEKWVFVHPQHRRAPHARALLEMARSIAKGARLPLLAGVTSGIRTEGKVKLFIRTFGAPIGASFLVGVD